MSMKMILKMSLMNLKTSLKMTVHHEYSYFHDEHIVLTHFFLLFNFFCTNTLRCLYYVGFVYVSYCSLVVINVELFNLCNYCFDDEVQFQLTIILFDSKLAQLV